MEFNEEFFVALGFVLFVLLLAYYGVHKQINAALDKRAERIKAELAEAEKLRAEATALLASFEKKRSDAEAEAEAIVAQARFEAEVIAREAHERIAEFVRRRTKQAEEKISNAEAQATAQVKAAAADAAAKAAETVLKAEARGGFGETLVTQGIADLKRLFH
jgi:F-type H+-transporting ATPase subunit b